jgi:hypothetical protein
MEWDVLQTVRLQGHVCHVVAQSTRSVNELTFLVSSVGAIRRPFEFQLGLGRDLAYFGEAPKAQR